MNDTPCLLTVGDFSALETLHERWVERNHTLAPALRTKLAIARVVFPDDLPRDIASLGSRIAFAIGEHKQVAALTGAVSHERDRLPITTPVGLALLGRREGWAMNLEIEPGQRRFVTLGRVVEQPEAAWPGRFASHRPRTSEPLLRLVSGSRVDRVLGTTHAHSDDDDPGPAAA